MARLRHPESGLYVPEASLEHPEAPLQHPEAPLAWPQPPAGGADVTPPALVSAEINAAGTSLTLTYDEALDDTSEPAVGAFTLAGALISVITAVNVTGSTVVLTLSPAVGSTEAGITLDYTAGGSPIQDLAGNDAANLNDQAVTNNSAHAFTPTDIAGLKGWFDMQDAGSYTQAGTVTSITNKASSVAWTEATVPPPYNATGLNGHPAMVPTGTQRIISNEAALLALFTDVAARTVGFVGSVTVADSTRSFFGAGRSDSADSSVRMGTNTTLTGRYTHATRNAAGTTTSSESTGASDTNNNVQIWTRSATVVSLQTNNAAADPSASGHATGTTTPTRMALCARPNSAIDTHWIGNWGELVIYDSVLSAGAITALYNYLDAKWL